MDNEITNEFIEKFKKMSDAYLLTLDNNMVKDFYYTNRDMASEGLDGFIGWMCRNTKESKTIQADIENLKADIKKMKNVLRSMEEDLVKY